MDMHYINHMSKGLCVQVCVGALFNQYVVWVNIIVPKPIKQYTNNESIIKGFGDFYIQSIDIL